MPVRFDVERVNYFVLAMEMYFKRIREVTCVKSCKSWRRISFFATIAVGINFNPFDSNLIWLSVESFFGEVCYRFLVIPFERRGSFIHIFLAHLVFLVYHVFFGIYFFHFNRKNYLQIHGTTMGSKMAIAFANIFMADIEAQIVLAKAS